MLCIFTLAFNAQPFIELHLPIFEKLSPGQASDWHWCIVHGPSNNGGSTKWCQPQSAGLSTDGTTEYLHSIRRHPHVTLLEKKLWPSKDAMVNAALASFDKSFPSLQPSVLLQIDSDELWTAPQLRLIAHLFADRPQLSSIMFPCRYFVGPSLILRGENCYGDFPYEWLRAWRYTPGSRFTSHEPPVLDQSAFCNLQSVMPKSESRNLGLTFDHHAYATEAQCAYKERFYGYPGLVNQWRALQRYFQFQPPTSELRSPPLSRFFPHVKSPLPQVIKI